jgi:hypothetical protein
MKAGEPAASVTPDSEAYDCFVEVAFLDHILSSSTLTMRTKLKSESRKLVGNSVVSRLLSTQERGRDSMEIIGSRIGIESRIGKRFDASGERKRSETDSHNTGIKSRRESAMRAGEAAASVTPDSEV